MLLAIFTVFLQFQPVSMYSETITGNETLFTRGSDQLSWIAAREACDSMSYTILTGMQDARALGLLHVGEFAWIDGKEYTFCIAKKINETKEKCRYVTLRREDTRENLTYFCDKDSQFVMKEEMIPYADAVKQCVKSMASLLVVEKFVLPMVVPVNRTNWIGDYNDSRIIDSLRSGQTVTQICIGIVKLDHDKFELGTASCNENHTVICDATGVNTSLTLTTRDEMMPRIGDLKDRIAYNQQQTVDLKFISLGSTFGVLIVAIAIIVIVHYRSKYRKRRTDVQRRQDREMLPEDNIMRQDMESESQFLPCNSSNVKHSTQGHGNNPDDRKGYLGNQNNDSPLASSQNPIDDNNSSNLYHLEEYVLLAKQSALFGNAKSSGSQKCVFPVRESHDSHKYKTMSGKERERKIVMYTDDENQYENYRKVEVPLEYQGDNRKFRENPQV